MLQRHAALAIAFALSMAACETLERQSYDMPFADDPRLGERVNSICFGSQIDGFGETTERTIIVSVGPNRDYLVETFGYCPDLEFAQSVAFDQFSSCLHEGDSIIPFESAFGPNRVSGVPTQECIIRSIYEWDPDAAADEPGEDV